VRVTNATNVNSVYIMEIKKIENPFTRFELPDGVEIKLVGDVHMLYCKDIESSRRLRTQIIKAAELLDFYIEQIELDGEIRYLR